MKQVLSIILFLSALLLVAAYLLFPANREGITLQFFNKTPDTYAINSIIFNGMERRFFLDPEYKSITFKKDWFLVHPNREGPYFHAGFSNLPEDSWIIQAHLMNQTTNKIKIMKCVVDSHNADPNNRLTITATIKDGELDCKLYETKPLSGAPPLARPVLPSKQQETRTYDLQNLKAAQGGNNGQGAITPTPELYAPKEAQLLPQAPTAATTQKKLVKEEVVAEPQSTSNQPDCTVSGYKYNTEQGVKQNIGNLKDAEFGCKIKVKK